MALSEESRRKIERIVAEMRRGRVSSQQMAEDFLSRLDVQGLQITALPPEAKVDDGASSLLLRRAAQLEASPNLEDRIESLRLTLRAIGG